MIRTLAFAAIALAAIAVAPAHAQSTDRAVVESFYTQLLNGAGSGDLGKRAETVLSANWESIGDYSGRNKTRPEFVGQLGAFAQMLPDMKWQIVEIIEAGNRYVVRGRATGTPAKPFFGVEPNGKSFDIMSLDIHTVEGGRIVRSYHIEDWASALRQLRTP